ncbi:MAG: lipopolysaccharide transport periplasmic protein LptA [Alphaproteobacteria bacterium]|nr:lipopolysaccharide transport periplasmic protein LptA [Alphaproteobacteria bacterium]
MAKRGVLVLACCLWFGAQAFAQPVPGAVSGHDSSQPIEINADTLEVKQDERVAEFVGNVNAIQGNIVLRAEKMVVHYRQAGDGRPGTFSRIDVVGDVFIATPEETAQGLRGVYDADRRTVDLFGSVVLTRGENVIRGDKLVLNLETGKSKIEGQAKGAGNPGRVRGYFVPERKPGR